LEFLASITLLLLTCIVPVLIVRDWSQGTVPLVCTRNIFLMGFVYFQTFSGLITSATGLNERGLVLNDPGSSSLGFAVLSTVFLILFLSAYKFLGRLFSSVDLRKAPTAPSVQSLAFMAVVCLGVGLLFRFVLAYVPVLGVITVQFAVGAFVAACCLMMVAWSRNTGNLVIALMAASVVAASIAALLVNAFGRREILGVFMSMAWTLFFVKWRFLPKSQLVARSLFWVSVTLIAVVILTAARASGEKERSVSDYLRAFSEVSLQDFVTELVGGVAGQFAGGTSMWVYETRPDEFQYQPLHTIWYIITFPIPRQYWDDKPNSLGRLITQQCSLSGVGDDHSFGPGMVGHIANDFPPLSLPLYPVLLAAFFVYCDRRLRSNEHNALEVIVLGAGISQIFALSRGELGLFFINATGTMFGAWIVVAPYSRFAAGPDETEVDVE
jgi:hypothetical protein